MDLERIGCLIRLRYKLLWARTRTRNGRIALFVTGYLLLALGAALFGIVGAGGGMAAVRTGQAEPIAQGVLAAFFATALATSVMLGFGLNAAFSDAQLRSFPLTAFDRRIARHFTGIVDPFWFLFVILDLGLAIGLYLFGSGSLLLGVLAVLLLYVCNYLSAQLLSLGLDRIMQQKGGTVLLPIAFMALCMMPGALFPAIRKNPALLNPVLRVVRGTPPFAAGSMMAGSAGAALAGVAVLLLWIAALAAGVTALERRPPRVRAVRAGRIRWDTPFERLGALFGPGYGPLVTLWLQFLFRCRRFKITYLMSVPLLPFLMYVWTKDSSKGQPFMLAIGIFAISGLAPAGAFVVNQFGYVGHGFRRYFLFPIDPGAALRASSVALLALSSASLAVAAGAWAVIGPPGYGLRGFAMLASAGLCGLFLFHSVGLWCTLYGARRCDPNRTMGNDLSLAGNLVVIGGMMTGLMGPMIASRAFKISLTPDNWWRMALLTGMSGCVYVFSVGRASGALPGRRESMLAIVDGRA